MTTKKIPFNYDINRMLAVDLIAIIHIDDYDTRFLELTLFDDGTPFSVEGCIVTSRFVTISGSYLLSDNVPCEATGNAITIPIDAAAVQMMACDIKIEVNIVDGEKILTLPFPLWVRVRGSILETAHVTPESQGTIPELLEAVKEELERVQGYVDEEQVKNIIDGVLSGVTTNVPTLLIDNTVNQQYNPDGHLIWYYIDSDGARHNLFDFTPYLGGTDDYTELENKPSINDVILQGNKTSSELGLQDKLTAGDNVTIDENGVISAEGGTDDYNDLENKPQISGVTLSGDKTPDELGLQKKLTIQSSGSDPNEYLFLRNNGYLGFNSQFVLSIQSSGFPKLSYWNSVSGVASITTNSIVSDGLTVGINENIPVSEGGTYYRFCTNGETRKEIYLTNSGKAYQKLTTLPGGTWVEGQWQEIGGGGSQIVSGVVNQNGTITFNDGDGVALFTTSGGNLVTSGAQQINMGYDSGGFYFLFDDGQEA